MDLIINADDFGKCHAVNVAIRDAFRQGLISSTTLMANMDGFDEAVDMPNWQNVRQDPRCLAIFTNRC